MKRCAALLLALIPLLSAAALRPEPDDRQVLTLATILLDETVERAVDAFNAEDPDYTVQVTDYYDKRTNDYDGAWAALNAALETGDGPDLLDLSGLLSTETDGLIQRSLLADLTAYIDTDPDIRREDYVPAVWDAAAVNGRVYAAAAAFSVTTLVCRPGDLPDGGMTWERFAQMVQEGESMFLFGDMSDPSRDQARLLRNLLRARFGEFVDEAAGTCAFDSPAFTELLEFVKTIPCSDETARLAEMAIQFGYGDLTFAPSYIGSDMAFCGWPGTDGAVGYLALRGAAAMCADTDCPEGCWAFLRRLLLSDVPSGGLPARLDRRRAAAEAAMADCGVTQAQIDAVDRLMDQALTRDSRLKTDILGLAETAAASYYADQTTAPAAAADLQSRACLYFSDQS